MADWNRANKWHQQYACLLIRGFGWRWDWKDQMPDTDDRKTMEEM
jgi:hypothetical protein